MAKIILLLSSISSKEYQTKEKTLPWDFQTQQMISFSFSSAKNIFFRFYYFLFGKLGNTGYLCTSKKTRLGSSAGRAHPF